MKQSTARRSWRTILVATALLVATFSVSSAFAFCGDGTVEINEACDDGNTVSGDCCDANCQADQNGTACTDDGNQCTIDTCNGQGLCDHVIRQGSCDDGNGCTAGDTCNADGFCVSGETLPDGNTCSDRNFCGGIGTCSGGFCYGAPVDCSGYGDACNTATCDAQTGQCVATPAQDGTACGGGNFCYGVGACSSGECLQPPTDCSSYGDDCNTAYCDVELQRCDTRPKETGSSCDDGNGCTERDSCTAGLCDGAPRDCSFLTDACNVGVCNGDLGDCQADPRPSGELCDDANTCTTGDQCTSGSCGGSAVQCGELDGPCIVGTCNAQTGGCESAPRPNGEVCTDGNTCTTGDQCTDGSCGGSAVQCGELDGPCILGACNARTGGCESTSKPNGETCNDANTCTTDDQCTGGNCSGSAVNCSGLDGECIAGVCNAQNGSCATQPKSNGTACNDGAFCTQTDTCSGGVCSGTGNPCTDGGPCASTCNETNNTCYAASGTACPSDGNPCTNDVCDGEGTCNALANNAACDDGLFCTTGDHCSDGTCLGSQTCPSSETCGDTCNESENACRTCGHPFSNARCIVNAVFVLQGALGLRPCDVCTCDVDNNGVVSATDALRILRNCVNLPSPLVCPAPTDPSTTTTTISVSTTTLIP